MPGRVVDGALIRRPVIFYNICYGVNAFADPARHEAAYLFLQWAGGARVYTFLTFNPAATRTRTTSTRSSDPYTCRRATSRSRSAQFANIVPRTAPPITLKGGGAYRDSLSEEIQKVLTGQQSPEQAAAGARGRAGTRSRTSSGVEIQVEALETFNSAFPTVVDTPGEQLRHGGLDRGIGVRPGGPAGRPTG